MMNFKSISLTILCFLLQMGASIGQNLLVNGNFEGGNTGFISGHTYSPSYAVPEGTYDVNTSPRRSHPFISLNFGDHTTGSGKMLLVNISPALNRLAWSQTVAVKPNRSYFFSGWGTSWSTMIPLRRGFPSPSTGRSSFPKSSSRASRRTGRDFWVHWNSGASTNARIEIRSLRNERLGNDLVLDDLSMFELLSVDGSTSIYTAVEVVWPTVRGRFYQVQWTTNVTNAEWHNLGEPIPGDGQMGSRLDGTRVAEQRMDQSVIPGLNEEASSCRRVGELALLRRTMRAEPRSPGSPTPARI